MNRRALPLYLLAIAIVASGCDSHREKRKHSHEHTVTITRTWPAADIRNLKVFEVDGSIKVEASQTSEISLVAEAKGDLELEKGKENDGLFETKLEGDTLRIGRKEKEKGGKIRIRFFFDMNDVRVNYVLKVPPSVSLDVATINGRITTRGMAGETAATTVNGGLDLESTGAKEMSATTVNGRVKARFTESFQGARFKTVNGGVEATLPQNASFSVDLAQVNGDFEASFPLSIHSAPGSRRVSGEVNGGEHELKITTVNGDVQLARLNDGR
jgi:hypothetical protein